MSTPDRDREREQAEDIAVPDANLPADLSEGIGAGLAGDEKDADRPSPDAPGQPADRETERAEQQDSEIRPAG